jgi:hypothetical protein
MNVFSFIDSITYSKKNLLEEDFSSEKEYIPYLVNKHLSLFPDTIFYSNNMNKYGFLSKKYQYDYLRFSIRKRKRYTKWPKKEKNTEIDCVSEYYDCSKRKAKEYVSILSKDKLDKICSILEGKKG